MKKITLVNIDTKEEYEFIGSFGLSEFFPSLPDSSYQVRNLTSGHSKIATIYGIRFCLKGKEPNTLKVKDLITKEIIEAFYLSELANKLNCDKSAIQRLLNRNLKGPLYNHIKDRYVNMLDSKLFSLIDYDTGEEFECCSNSTLFLHFNIPQNENLNKHISAVKRGKQSVLSFCGRILYLKGKKPDKVRPQKSMTPSFLKQLENEKINRKIKSKLFSRLSSLKRRGNFEKSDSTLNLLGCSPVEFKTHIESQFQEGMTWNNHGSESTNGERSWHIDHIIPCNTFDLTKEDNQRKCFHYSNLRPLWENENLGRPKDGRDV